MTARTARRLAWAIAWGCVGITLVAVAFSPASGLSPLDGFRPHEVIIGTLFPLIGALIVSRQRGNAVGWVMIAAGASWGLDFAITSYAWYAGVARPGTPGAGFATWIGQWDWMPGSAFIFVFLFLLFPDGHLPSPRWRLLPRVAGVALIFAVLGSAVAAWPHRNQIEFLTGSTVDTKGAAAAIGTVTFMIVVLSALPAASSLFLRYRRSRGEQREQIRLLAYSSLFFVVSTFGDLFFLNGSGWLTILPIALLPAAIGVAILRHGLYDFNLVIKKTFVFAAIALAVAGAFFAVVAGLGLAATSGASARTALLAGLAMGILVLPIGRIARRVSNRLVFGRRATPYEVLTGFSHRVGEAYATEDVLERMAQLLRDAIGAELARIWLRLGSELRVVASAPEAPTPAPRTLIGDELPDLGEPHAFEVRDRGELLGALTAALPANDPMSPMKDKLVRDLASQAGLVLRNVRLIEELRASRQRLVAAQDEERRKIERNLHDGAQQQLVALSVQLKLARQLLDRDQVKAGEMLDSLQGNASDAIEQLRDLARGIYPPLLADKGLQAALEAQARRAAVPTTVEASNLSRFPPKVESAIYFCALEALNNVAKYANASSATVRLSHEDGSVRFEVADDGVGFDSAALSYGTGLQGMADRLAALDGDIEVTSALGSGTVVKGRVPTKALGR